MPIVLEDVPGMLEALHAVQYVGGVLLSPEAAHQLVVAAWYAAEPASRAAAFADAADLLHEYGEMSTVPGYRQAAELLDTMSYLMRSPQ